jgi:hypothetical protein
LQLPPLTISSVTFFFSWPLIQRFTSSLAQYLDKHAILLYGHLLSVLPERHVAPHVTPSLKVRRLFVEDPRALVRHLAKRVQELNDKLFDFAKKTMHAPQWGEELQEILDVRDTMRRQLSAATDRGPLPGSN